MKTSSMNWQRRAWLLPAAGTSVLASIEPSLTQTMGEGPSAGIVGVVGIVIGWFWYRMYPRTLSDRLFGLACVLVVALVLAFMPGTEVSGGGPAMFVYLGVLAGLVFNEQWSTNRRTASSRESQRSLR